MTTNVATMINAIDVDKVTNDGLKITGVDTFKFYDTIKNKYVIDSHIRYSTTDNTIVSIVSKFSELESILQKEGYKDCRIFYIESHGVACTFENEYHLLSK